ncbi:GIY-YIG Endonuclease [Clavibacter phage CN1A]|uniref:GIY-YIG Endonuclease n=1 Tax=Clavibacter phage CN1A TaxID=1406793 RepID=U5PTQ9_9CAUD|nr:GIY-YIG Endonuclease [Clavibacter phage CN1A]AGY47141.1 GIY-YIG Endonuclease [Clavibacter phage CN1A]
MNKNMNRQPCVYGLEAGGFLYVGVTTVNPKTRWWGHRGRARGGHTAPVYERMREVGIDAVKIVVLEECEADRLEGRELFWIQKLKSEGHDLTNQIGADGKAKSMSASSRSRIGAAKAGKPTWIKGKTGAAAGWTPERKAAQRARIIKFNQSQPVRSNTA